MESSSLDAFVKGQGLTPIHSANPDTKYCISLFKSSNDRVGDLNRAMNNPAAIMIMSIAKAIIVRFILCVALL
jgi:hypothetical protein